MKQIFWPDNVSRRYGNEDENILIEKIRSAKKLAGVISDISWEAAEMIRDAFFTSTIDGNGQPEWCFLVGINPASATQEDVLLELLDFQKCTVENTEGSASFRLLLPRTLREEKISMNVVVGFNAEGKCFLHIGSLESVGVGCDSVATANLLIESPEPLLVDECRKFFDYHWELGVELNDSTARMPRLFPAKGDPEATLAWQQYQSMCIDHKIFTEFAVADAPDVDEETGEVLKNEGEKLSEILKLPEVDKLERVVSELYAKGKTVTLEHKNKPLQAPLSARALGIESLREDAGVTMRVDFHVDLFDADTQRKVTRLRDKVRENINLFGYKLADGYTWIPDSARGKVDERMQNLKHEVEGQLSALLQGDVGAFLNSRRDAIRNSCERYAREMAPNVPFKAEVVDKVIEELRQRAGQAIDGNYLPKTTFSSVPFDPITRAPHEDGWAQAAKLIGDIAIKPREAIFGEFYFVRNLRPDLDMSSYFELVNVLDDYIIELFDRDYREAQKIAAIELRLVKEIKDYDSLAGKDKCRVYVMLIQGKFAKPADYWCDSDFRRAVLDLSWMYFDKNEENLQNWKRLMLERIGPAYENHFADIWNVLEKWPQDKKFVSGIAVDDLK